MSAHQVHGGVRSKEFGKLLKDIESDIEKGLKDAISRSPEGIPHKVGVDVPDLEESEEGLSYEDHLWVQEAHEWLRFMQAAREARK